PTTLQTVAGLQGADRGLDPRMTLPRFAIRNGSLLLLLSPLLLAFRHKARRRHDLAQVLLILRRVKGPIKGGTLDLALKAILQPPHFRHYLALIQHTLAEHPIVNHKPHCSLDHQHILSKLSRIR